MKSLVYKDQDPKTNPLPQGKPMKLFENGGYVIPFFAAGGQACCSVLDTLQFI